MLSALAHGLRKMTVMDEEQVASSSARLSVADRRVYTGRLCRCDDRVDR